MAAATGNVTNQAVQFQNNGAPSRQQYGSAISCNGSTMTFSPFYMGNDTSPYDPEGYVISENWGFQINFSVPLNRDLTKQCQEIAKRQEEKMRLDYELTRMLRCAELQRKGFMLAEGTRVYTMCNDVVPIVKYEKEKKAAVKQYLKKECTPKEKKFLWSEQEYDCPTKPTDKT